MFKKSSPPRPADLAPRPTEPATAPSPGPAYKPIQLSLASARAAPGAAASLLGAGLVFEGAISGEGDLTIEGTMRGDIAAGRVVIGENAAFEGRIRAHQVEVRGRVTGDIEAQAVKLAETAYMQGDITHGQLAIEAGARFEGRCQALRSAEAAPEADSLGADVVDLDAARA